MVSAPYYAVLTFRQTKQRERKAQSQRSARRDKQEFVLFFLFNTNKLLRAFDFEKISPKMQSRKVRHDTFGTIKCYSVPI